jgi:hypothetical protein
MPACLNEQWNNWHGNMTGFRSFVVEKLKIAVPEGDARASYLKHWRTVGVGEVDLAVKNESDAGEYSDEEVDEISREASSEEDGDDKGEREGKRGVGTSGTAGSKAVRASTRPKGIVKGKAGRDEDQQDQVFGAARGSSSMTRAGTGRGGGSCAATAGGKRTVRDDEEERSDDSLSSDSDGEEEEGKARSKSGCKSPRKKVRVAGTGPPKGGECVCSLDPCWQAYSEEDADRELFHKFTEDQVSVTEIDVAEAEAQVARLLEELSTGNGLKVEDMGMSEQQRRKACRMYSYFDSFGRGAPFGSVFHRQTREKGLGGRVELGCGRVHQSVNPLVWKEQARSELIIPVDTYGGQWPSFTAAVLEGYFPVDHADVKMIASAAFQHAYETTARILLPMFVTDLRITLRNPSGRLSWMICVRRASRTWESL